MMTIARVVAVYAADGYRADLDVPRLFEGHTLPRVKPIAALQTTGVPKVGDDVILLVEGGETYRYLPLRPVLQAVWMSADRVGLHTRTGDVVVVLDDSDRTVRIGRAAADKRVVHEGVKARLDAHKAVMDDAAALADGITALATAVATAAGVAASPDVVAAVGAVTTLRSALTSALSALATGDATVATYTAEGVLVHTDKPTAGAGGA